MSEPEVTRERMLDVLERIEDETRDEIRVIKKGEWAETRLPLMEERIRAVASLRRLIEKQGELEKKMKEWQRIINETPIVGIIKDTIQHPEALGQDIWYVREPKAEAATIEILSEIRDFGKEG